MTRATTVVVALVQAEPAVLDLDGSIDRAVAHIADAAAHGAKLVAFGETWLSGYPVWVDVTPSAAAWDEGAIKDVHARLRAAALTVPGPALARLQAAAAEHAVTVVIGAHERVDDGPGNRSLYNALLVIDETGALVVHHRKLVPTHGERIVWAPGDADGLHPANTGAGRVGGLICWEHWMPLARQALHDEGEDIHIAQWPTVNDVHQLASRHYAFEGRCFVLAVGSLLRIGALPEAIRPPGDPSSLAVRGGSCIIGPDGRWVVEPVFDEERLIVAELDLAAIDRESMALDVSGHYARPDVLRLSIERPRRRS